MKLLTRVGGSVALFYFVIVVFAVCSVGPSVVVQQAHADSTVPEVSEPVKKEVQEEASGDQSVVDKAADKIPNWLELLGTLIGVASAIAAVTPTPKDNVALGVLRKVLDIFALNIGGAKNAAAEDNKAKRY